MHKVQTFTNFSHFYLKLTLYVILNIKYTVIENRNVIVISSTFCLVSNTLVLFSVPTSAGDIRIS